MTFKIITHRSVQTNFRVNPKNGMLGGISRTFKRDKMDQQIGELFEIIARELIEDSAVFSFKSPFTLINVTNWVNGYSIGYSVTPPKATYVSDPALVFTFSLSNRPYKSTTPTADNVYFSSEGTESLAYWSNKRNAGRDYLTISLAKTTLRKLKLSFNSEPELTYLYNCIGMLTKSFVLNSNWYSPNNTHTDANTPTVNEYTLYSKYFERTMRTMINDHPMNTWMYNRDIWFQAQNLISPKFLNLDAFGLYYLMYLVDIVPTRPQSSLWKSIHSPIGGIKDYIAQGIQDFNTGLKNPLAEVTDHCYAVLHLLETQVNPGGFGAAIDKELAKERIQMYAHTFEDFPDKQTEFYSFMSDTNAAYNALVNGNTRFMDIMESIL